MSPVRFCALILAFVPTVTALQVGDAQIVIDDFTTGTYSDTLSQSNPTNEHVDVGMMQGGFRRSRSHANFPQPIPTTIEVQNGAWSLIDAIGGIREVSTSWGHATGAGSMDLELNLDVTNEAPFFEIDMASVEQNVRLILRVHSGVNEGMHRSTGTSYLFTAASNTPQTVQIPFSLPVFSAIDFSDIDGLQFFLDFPSRDFTMTEFRVGTLSVPEPRPSSVVLFGVGGLFIRRKREL